MTTADAPVQTVWECRWSRPGYRVFGVPEELQPETPWVCVRTAERRPVTEEECEGCPQWEEHPSRSPQ